MGWDRTEIPGSPYYPSATGSNNGGVGIASDANFKDIYASFNYRFNLERDKQSRTAIQAAGPSGPRDHTYLNFGTYYFYGRSVQRLLGETSDGTSTVVTAREPFYRVGGNFTFNYHNLQINGALHVRARSQSVTHRLQRDADSSAESG